MKQKTDELLKKLDAELFRIYETKDILYGRVCKDYSKPYEVVVFFPSSMGERGFQFSQYYNDIPEPEEIYNDFRKELREWIKDKSAFCGAYEEQACKIGKKVLRSCIKKENTIFEKGFSVDGIKPTNDDKPLIVGEKKF